METIRYAEPPTGLLRLRRPVRRAEAGGETELDVSGTSSVVCPQWSADFSRVLGQEDCLLLNVYVPGDIRWTASYSNRFVRWGRNGPRDGLDSWWSFCQRLRNILGLRTSVLHGRRSDCGEHQLQAGPAGVPQHGCPLQLGAYLGGAGFQYHSKALSVRVALQGQSLS